ncbi:hypothetical protein, partial [Brucella sp. IR073]|uniref:hypothetical protein n=1 Tax=unclassified Brucella TaxID=2632610 RepID=UPI003B97DD11
FHIQLSKNRHTSVSNKNRNEPLDRQSQVKPKKLPEPQNRTGEARLMIAFASAVNSFFQSRPTFQAFATRPKFSSLFRPLRQNKKPVSHPTQETKHPAASGAAAVVVALYRPHSPKLSTPKNTILEIF